MDLPKEDKHKLEQTKQTIKIQDLTKEQAKFITSTKEVMFLPDFVCLFVCLCVSKITQKVMDGSF